MIPATVLQAIAQVARWLLAYALLLVVQCGFESWLAGRLQRRNGPVHWLPRIVGPRPGLGIVVLGVGLAGGALLPLAPGMAVYDARDATSGILVVLALFYTGTALLALSGNRYPAFSDRGRHLGAAALLSAFPVALILPSLLTAVHILPAHPDLQPGLQALLAAQGGWYGMQWIVFIQPLAGVLWVACMQPITPTAQARRSLPWQMLKLDRALLTNTLLLGGWQGPLAAQAAQLGLAYTALKVIALCALEVWLESRRFSLDVPRQARRVWTWYVPLAALNLCLTAGLVAML